MSKQNATATSDFFGMLVEWLTSLPTDIKILIEMAGDNDLDLGARSLAVGTIVYVLSPIDLIPEKVPVLGYIDDVIILHMSVAAIVGIDPERGAHYREKYPQVFESLDQHIGLLQDTLGALYSWIMALVERLKERRYQGRSPEDVAASENLQEELFDEAMEYAANVNVDPDAIQRALLAAPPERIIGFLSAGLEEEQKLRAREDEEGVLRRLSGASSGFRKLLGQGQTHEDET